MNICYVNGKYLPKKNSKISIEDRGLNFSDSVYEVIAFKSKKILSNDFYKFSYDNFFLTTELLKLNFKHFIFISSIGIYPQSHKVYNEESNFEIKTRNNYEFLKIMSENFIQKSSKKFTIFTSSVIKLNESKDFLEGIDMDSKYGIFWLISVDGTSRGFLDKPIIKAYTVQVKKKNAKKNLILFYKI